MFYCSFGIDWTKLIILDLLAEMYNFHLVLQFPERDDRINEYLPKLKSNFQLTFKWLGNIHPEMIGYDHILVGTGPVSQLVEKDAFHQSIGYQEPLALSVLPPLPDREHFIVYRHAVAHRRSVQLFAPFDFESWIVFASSFACIFLINTLYVYVTTSNISEGLNLKGKI